MKTINLNKIVLLLLGLVVFSACVQDDDFDTPNTVLQEPVLSLPTITVESLINSYNQAFLDAVDDAGLDIDNFFDEDPIRELREDFVFSLEFQENYVSGYVISNDEAGNFFEELIIQNTPDQGSSGLRVMLDVNPLFGRYRFGQLIYVKLNQDNLHMGISNGVLTLGIGEELEKIPSFSEEDFIARSPQIEDIVPTEVTFADIFEVPDDFQQEILSEGFKNVFIRVNNVQFNRSLVINNSTTFAGEAQDEFDGERVVESCEQAGSSIILSTSTFADFKSLPLPSGQGSINAILSRDFFNEAFNLVINSPEDISFGGEENRCDPDFLECTTPSGGGSNLYEEDFESFGSFGAEGWTNVNITATSTDWFIDSFSGDTYAAISAFNSDDEECDVWLVTPAIDMDTTTDEELTFEVQPNFDNGTILSVFISTDFAGDPTTATWQQLDAPIPVGPGGFGDFEEVGPINISCVDGTAHIGFFYEGADPSATTRYHIDDVTVTGID
ncbi:MAG: hypothetical protein HRU26_17960 [Psychroserpens sp.]|nr:hypothetical protein [Psychroserpens sp.]